jgi:hypothetical protein
VVERAYAQLPGANNLGHKTGWCHSSGMRDPAQTTDAARNVNMNAKRSALRGKFKQDDRINKI